jgi:hypothetical protein
VHGYEIALFAGLVALVIAGAIVFVVTRGGGEDPLAATEGAGEPRSAVMNTEPWGEPDAGLLDSILNPPAPASAGVGTEAVMVQIGGFAIAEPWGEPSAALLEALLDPLGAALRAMEPVGEPDAALLEGLLDPVGAALRAMEPVGEPDYASLFAIVGPPNAEPVSGPR